MTNMKDFSNRRNYENHLLLEQKMVEIDKAIDEVITREHCEACGRFIPEWDDVEFTGDKVILTHRCECGRYAEKHYKLVYDHTEIIEEGE